MSPTATNGKAAPLTLRARTAADVMTANPISIGADASIGEAIALLTGKGFSAAPVIDEAGRPVGVMSRADIIVHERHAGRTPDYYGTNDLRPRPAEGAGAESAEADVRVRHIMTPAVFSVTTEAPVRRVVGDLVALKVHRLFVVDRSGVLVGVVSALDVLRHLNEETT